MTKKVPKAHPRVPRRLGASLEAEIAGVLLQRLNDRVMWYHVRFWGYYIAAWLLMVLIVFFVLVETDWIIAP